MSYLIRWISDFGFNESELDDMSDVKTFVNILMGNYFEMIQVSNIEESEK
jgi:hypothetical protein